MSASVEFHLFF